jgi:hypothetical protein
VEVVEVGVYVSVYILMEVVEQGHNLFLYDKTHTHNVVSVLERNNNIRHI